MLRDILGKLAHVYITQGFWQTAYPCAMESALRVRFVLLIARYACAHISFTPPNPPPDADEQAKYEVDGERRVGESLTSFSIMYAINSAKVFLYNPCLNFEVLIQW